MTVDPYDLVDDSFAVPALPGRVVTGIDADDVHGALGADLLLQATNCVRAHGDFHLALSGGSTPLPFYRCLMVDPRFRQLPWERTHLWIVDERCVPPDDERCNFLHIRETIVEHVDIAPQQVHPVDAHLPGAAAAYDRALRETLAWREPGHDRLDFVLLGMGDDGHTASLFPHSPALAEPDALVIANDGPAVTPPPRITMTYRLLNASRFVAVLVLGARKHAALERVAKAGPEDADRLPIRGIAPTGGELRWYLDRAACTGAEAP
jgi:6-phosphogluconolactonase